MTQAAETIDGATALALAALGWVVSDGPRARRLIDLTGLDPADLRARAAEPDVLAAVLGFLEAHEPDLVACAAAADVEPAALVRARATLESA
ncbi:DUF3572 family protein [Sphingomonas sp.]|uniref:DUF3572 family protein n=1 Tax=Sphingomonas sp. TaxID=28214 RepID=UPI001EBE501D|nr:DUF3572 family protein [Sphingomonas sp.]MBX3595843.1 DUF3572 family protein [Sphingomonas sp.]